MRPKLWLRIVSRPSVAAGVALAAFISTSTAPAVAGFPSQSTDFASPGAPFHIAIGDFNEDGTQDLVTASGTFVAVHLGVGNGSFGAAQTFVAGADANSVAVGDFNSDGHQDVAVSSAILLGAGDGTFGLPLALGVGAGPQFVAVGDFNADGRLDLAIALGGTTPGEVSVLLGNGNATFEPEVRYGVGNLPRTVAVADFDGDGNQDLALANRNPPQPARPDSKDVLSILSGQGDGTFTPQIILATENTRGNGIVVGDFNGDGDKDLTVGSEGETGISIHLGNGDGSFVDGTRLEVGACPIKLALGDFNLDQIQDMATSNWCGASGNVTVLLGNGDGSFTIDGPYATDDSPVAVATGDFNEDGRQDLATANWFAASISILLNQGSTSGCLDTDDDGFGFPANPACPGGLQADCDDSSNTVFPGASEVCDSLDNDCDLMIDEGFDADADYSTVCAGDCDDADDAIYSGAPEANDGVDNQCPGDMGYGLIDEITGPAGFFNPLDRDEYSWPAQPGASGYEVVAAETSDFSFGCYTITTADTFWSDPQQPGSGIVLHYLVRAVSPLLGSWGYALGVERTDICP